AQPEEAIGLSQDAEAPEYAAASGTRLFLGGGYSAAWLRAFDLRTGQLLWERKALPRILSLTVDEGLYLNIWRRRYELIAVDVNTGQELWTAGVGGFFPPMWKDGWLYGNGEFSIFVADPTSGRIVHTIEAEDEVTTTPIRTGDLLLFGTINGALHAVRPGELERPARR